MITSAPAGIRHGGKHKLRQQLRTRAAASGYANANATATASEAIRAHVPWRPARYNNLTHGRGQRFNPNPLVNGPSIATVVGTDGSSDSGNPEIHTDRLGRIRIRHDFQTVSGNKAGEANTWVRVMRACAGHGIGAQLIHRIGQQVLVCFFEQDIDLPVVIGALHDGLGECGVATTPGGRAVQPNQTDVFKQSSDHQPSAQGNPTGGQAPPWHAASPDDIHAGGHRNVVALCGWKTKDFSGQGHNGTLNWHCDRVALLKLSN